LPLPSPPAAAAIAGMPQPVAAAQHTSDPGAPAGFRGVVGGVPGAAGVGEGVHPATARDLAAISAVAAAVGYKPGMR
jgi:hypothetical protein